MPENVVARGGAVAGVTVYHQNEVIAERQVIRSGEPSTISFPLTKDGNYRIVLDNISAIDTNWVLFRLEQKNNYVAPFPLNNANIANIIRDDGYRLWGSRSLSSDPKWAFVTRAHTLFIFMDAVQPATSGPLTAR